MIKNNQEYIEHWVKTHADLVGKVVYTEYIPFVGGVGVLVVVVSKRRPVNKYDVMGYFKNAEGGMSSVPVCKVKSLKVTKTIIKRMRRIVDQLPRHGDVIVMKRKHYDHFAIYDAKNSEFLEYTRGGEVHCTPLAVILRRELNRVMYRREYEDFFPPDEVVRRARSQIGNKEYHIYLKNCEHYVVWAKTGSSTSEMVDRVTLHAKDHFIGIGKYGAITAACSTILKLSGVGSILHNWLAGICYIFAAPLFPWFFGAGTLMIGISTFGCGLAKWVQYNVKRNKFSFNLNWTKAVVQ